MKIRVPTRDLQRMLDVAASVVPSRPARPALGGVKLTATPKGLRVMSTNLDATLLLQVDGLTEREGSVVVPAIAARQYVNALSGEWTELELTPKKRSVNLAFLAVQSGPTRGQLPTIELEFFPEEPSVEGDVLDMDALAFDELVSQVTPSVSMNSGNPALNAVLLCGRTDGTLMATSTDSYRMTKRIAPLMQSPSKEVRALVPLSALVLAQRLVRKTDDDVSLVVSQDGRRCLFQTDGITFITQLVEGNFPDLSGVKIDSPVAVAEFEREALMGAMARSALKTQVVHLTFTPDGRTTFVAESVESGSNEDTLQADYTGDPVDIWLRNTFFTEALRSLKEEKVKLEFQGRPDGKHGLAPLALRAAGRDDYTCMMMPINPAIAM